MVFAMLQLCYFSHLADRTCLFEKVTQFQGCFHCNI